MGDELVITGVVLGAAYLAGTVPFGVLFAKARGVDIQRVGSGNIGATNVARTLGKRLGAVVLLLDALKGALGVGAARLLQLAPWVVAAVALAAVVGHCFPPWLRFRGGKGVATALGAFLVMDPAATGIVVLVFAALYAVTRRVSLGSLVAALAFPIALWALDRPRELVWIAAATTLLIIVRHKDNIRRLLGGSEDAV